jgi:hypothetical protein
MRILLFTVISILILLPAAAVYAQGTDGQGKADSTAKEVPKQRVVHPWGKFGLSLSGGISIVSDSDYPKKDATDTTTTRPFMPSAQIGFYYNFYLGKYSVITIEPCVSMIQGNARTVIVSWGLEYIDELRKRLYFLCLPVSYGLNFGRFGISAGIRPSFLVFGQTQPNKVTITPVNSIPRGNSEYRTIGSHPFDLGAKAEISYNIYKRLSLFLHIYWGFMDIYRPAANETDPPVWYTRQLTLGIKCPLDKINKTEN